MIHLPEHVYQYLAESSRLWLFLDYDGTLADFAPTPEHVEPDSQVIRLIADLAREPRIRVTVISGRRLTHVEKLVPVPEAFLAGTYGIEIRTPTGRRIDRLDYKDIRPALAELKPYWAGLIEGREGFFLEDKGWSLAIHGRFAAPEQAEEMMEKARRLVDKIESDSETSLFQILDGHKFLEIGPHLAHKGKTVEFFVKNYPWPDAGFLYLGDDDKDQVAFETIHHYGGKAVLVSSLPRETDADGRLATPMAARRWLQQLPQQLGKTS